MKLLLRTLPHLRREQVIYRALRLAQYRLYRVAPRFTGRWTTPGHAAPEPSPLAVEAIRSAFANLFPHLNPPLREYQERLAALLNGRFTFLNQPLDLKEIDWNRRYVSHLWNYQLHYFGYSLWCARAFLLEGNERLLRRGRELVESWIEGARIGQSDGWDAYPVSLRVVNWVYAYVLLAGHYRDPGFLDRWRASIYRQLDFLSRHVEYQLLANHVIKNAKALVVGGLFFADDPRGRGWLARGEQLLSDEFDEQVLDDGGHYERSPMYHAVALADFLECFALLRGIGANHLADRLPKLRKMAGFLSAMTYADDTLALFNDSANTDDARPLPIIRAAERVCGGDLRAYPRQFPQAGYYLWNSQDGAERVIVDAGPPGVWYNAAHAHCDLLSYELWLVGRPLVVDSGVHGYGGDRFREYVRSTRAHNTVSFDGREQSELWGTFRMARGAEALGAEASGNAQEWEFRGAYRTYYDKRLVHERHIRREAAGEWVFTDIVRGGRAGSATSFIHLHPDVLVSPAGGQSLTVTCRIGSCTVSVEPFGAEGVEVVKGAEAPIQGWYFPDFGVARPSAAICFKYRVRSGEGFGYRIKIVLET